MLTQIVDMTISDVAKQLVIKTVGSVRFCSRYSNPCPTHSNRNTQVTIRSLLKFKKTRLHCISVLQKEDFYLSLIRNIPFSKGQILLNSEH